MSEVGVRPKNLVCEETQTRNELLSLNSRQSIKHFVNHNIVKMLDFS